MLRLIRSASLCAGLTLVSACGGDGGGSSTSSGGGVVTPIATPTPTPSPSAAPTPTPTPTPMPSPGPTPTPLPSPTPSPSPSPAATPTPTPTPTPTAALTSADAARLAKQASFGPTPALVSRIRDMGVDAWLNEQFAATGSTYADMAANDVRRDFCPGADTICNRTHFSRTPVAMRFYADAISAPDQLRQRVAFALAQIIVASEIEVNATSGIAAFNQIFLDNAFGNYRDILGAVTMSGYMGDYLDMADSNKSAPSENYARELLQLFSMGADQLNMDGTPKLDASGARMPTYSPDDIRGIARALTGWTQARINGGAITDGSARAYSKPMITVPARYDSTTKNFLGVTVPAGASQEASVAAVIDAAFNNPSTAPYIARALIGQLVTPNPSPSYIGRIAAVFANNGLGVRGDMKAVIRAILTDGEARGVPGINAGKLKEPILLMLSLARVIGFATDGYVFVNRDNAMGQPVMRSPSVFNFFPPDYPMAGSMTMRSPVGKLLNTSNGLRWHNLIYDWTISGDAGRTEYAADAGLPMSTLTQPLWAGWEAFGTDLDGMIERIDLLMLAGTMTAAQKNALKTAALPITNADVLVQARKRAQMMLYITASSPLFLVDR